MVHLRKSLRPGFFLYLLQDALQGSVFLPLAHSVPQPKGVLWTRETFLPPCLVPGIISTGNALSVSTFQSLILIPTYTRL